MLISSLSPFTLAILIISFLGITLQLVHKKRPLVVMRRFVHCQITNRLQHVIKWGIVFKKHYFIMDLNKRVKGFFLIHYCQNKRQLVMYEFKDL